MTTIYNVYDQIAGLIAQLEPEKILAIRASSEIQVRFDVLAQKAKNQKITPKEKDELDHFVVLERLFRLSKIKAHIAQKAKK